MRQTFLGCFFSYTVRRSIPLFSSQPHSYSCRDPKPSSHSCLCRTIAALSHISLVECYSILIPCLALRSRLLPRCRICIGSHSPICARKLKTSRITIVSVDVTDLVLRRLALGCCLDSLFLIVEVSDWLCLFSIGLVSHLEHRMPPELGLFSAFYLSSPPLKGNRSATLAEAGVVTSKLGSNALADPWMSDSVYVSDVYRYFCDVTPSACACDSRHLGTMGNLYRNTFRRSIFLPGDSET